MSMRGLTLSLFCLSLVLPAGEADAVALELVPSAQSISVGETVSADVNVLDLADPGLVSIHFDLFFAESVLSLVSATAGDFFANNDDGGAGSVWADFGAPVISTGSPVDTSILSALSTPDALGFDFIETNFQPSAVAGTLVTLTFRALAPGASGLSFNDVLLIDDAFNTSTQFSVAGSITVISASEPSALVLLSAVGVFLLLTAVKRKT